LSTPQSFGSAQELIQDLQVRLMNVPALQRALKKVALEGTRPKGQVYITRPSILDYEVGDPLFYQVGAKITYFNKEGIQEQFGQIARVASITRDGLLERAMYIMALELADGILVHEEAKKPLPIQALTAKDREELRLPF
jgi:hypothetical protein